MEICPFLHSTSFSVGIISLYSGLCGIDISKGKSYFRKLINHALWYLMRVQKAFRHPSKPHHLIFRWSCVESRVGLHNPCGSFSILGILWFYDCVMFPCAVPLCNRRISSAWTKYWNLNFLKNENIGKKLLKIKIKQILEKKSSLYHIY